MFMTNLGVGNTYTSIPAMLPQFNFKIEQADLDTFKRNAMKTIINGKPLRFREHNAGHISIEMGHINQTEIVMKVGEKTITPAETGLENVRISDQSSTTADHVPEGICFIYHPSQKKSAINKTVIETCTIFPTLLKNFGIAPPTYTIKSSDLIL